MKKIGIIILLLISLSTFGQNLSECGIDNNPELTITESNFLNEYMNDIQKKGFDFTGKKVLFITGSSGKTIGTKSQYFDNVKEWNKNGNKIVTSVVELDTNESKKINYAGYDVIVTYWVKVVTKSGKRKILNKINASR